MTDGGQPSEGRERKAVGDTVEDFELPGVGDDGIEQFRLSEYTDEGAVILVFYPFDFSPVCTSQLCGFRDAEWLTVAADVDVLAISVDSAYAHEAFRAEYAFQFPLLSDRLGEIADRFGLLYDEWEGHPAVSQRAIYAVDPDHTVRYRWVTDDAREQPSVDDVQHAIDWLDR